MFDGVNDTKVQADHLQRAGVSSPSANNTLMDKARQTYNRFDFELERVSFASNKTKQEHLIDCIQNNNRKLEKFLEYSGKVAALREDSAPKVRHSVAKHLLRYWTHANRLYDLLGRAWGCQCRDYHYARLYLQHRTSPSFELCLLVLYALTPSPAHAWREQSLKIEQVRNRDLADPGSISVPSLPSTAPSGVHAATPAKSSVLSRMKKKYADIHPIVGWFELTYYRFRDHKKQVAIQEAAPAPSAAPASLSSTISSLPGGPSIGVDIQHMCNIMSTCGVKAKCLGALRDDIADQTYSVSLQPAPQKSSDSITLHELLHDTSRPKMYRSQSYAIALAVCSSYLQLQSTAWANKVWTVKDINFPVVGGVPLLDQPYIATRFDDTQAATIQPPAALADRVFVCLGVMLLELCCRQLIEDSSWWQRLGADDAQKSQLWFRVSVAGEWLKEVEYEEGPEMASAIRWCLHESPRVFEGERWRKDLADRVVLPVQDCCRFLGGNILKT